MMYTTKSTISLFASLLALGLAGCTMSTNPAVNGTPNAAITGKAYGGQQPIAGATVQVRAAGTSGYGSDDTVLATTTSDSGGNFGFAANAYTCPQANTPVYVVAKGGDPGVGSTNANIAVAAGMGNCSDARNSFVVLNEVTTAATAYAMAQFFTPTLGVASTDSFGGPSSTAGSVTTYSKGLVAANAVTIPTIVDNPTGAPKTSSANIIVEAQKLLTIGNILAACVNSAGLTSPSDTTSNCGQLFAATTTPGGTAPSDTLQAAVQMAKYPYQNVSALLLLNAPTAPFGPGLASVNDWTLGVKYTTTAMSLTVNSGTTSNLDIDASGNIWLPSTSPAGVAVFSPAAGTFSGPYNPAGTVHPQNLAINSAGVVYSADAGSGLLAAVYPNGSSYGSIANVLSTSTGTVAIGPSNQVWYTNSVLGSNTLNELGAGLLSNLVTNLLTGINNNQVQSLAIAANNDVYAASTLGTTGYIEKFNASFVIPTNTVPGTYANAGLGQLALNGTTFVRSGSAGNMFCSLASGCASTTIAGLNAPQGVATDGDGRLWFANSGAQSVSTTNGSANLFTDFAGMAYRHTFTMVKPTGIGVDASGNVWVSNQTASGGPYVLSELVGAAAPTITPLSAQIAGGTSKVGTRPTN